MLKRIINRYIVRRKIYRNLGKVNTKYPYVAQ